MIKIVRWLLAANLPIFYAAYIETFNINPYQISVYIGYIGIIAVAIILTFKLYPKDELRY